MSGDKQRNKEKPEDKNKRKKTEHMTGIEPYYILKNNRRMRFGYTTGTCAAAAAKAAAHMMLTGDMIDYVRVMTPKGIELELEVVEAGFSDDSAACGIVKDAGDDPDVTDGMTVRATVERMPSGITITGGEGVGIVTKPGLEQPVGEAAINSTPRRMITEAVQDEAEKAGYGGGIKVTVSVSGGKEAAVKTFNPRLGIEGGISILGTSGIVEPMSEAALIESMEIEMRQQVAMGRKNIVAILGNYGREYLEGIDDFPVTEAVKCSNFVGETIDAAVSCGAEGLLFVAHIGKFIKVAGGIMNTHSRNADSRAEIMAAAAMRAGISHQAALEILSAATTEEALNIVDSEGRLKETMKEICDKIAFYIDNRCYGRIMTGALIFSNAHGYLGETASCRRLIERINGEKCGV